MAAPKEPWVLSWIPGVLRRFCKIVDSNTYADIQAMAPIQSPGQPQEPLTHNGAKHEKHPDLESNHKWPQPPGFVNAFDKVVVFAGTPLVFFFMIAGLLAWLIIGIVLGPSQAWQIAMQNVSSIQCYVSDTLLMRQQRNNSRDLLSLVCVLRSRNSACRRILEKLHLTNPSYFDFKVQSAGTEIELDIQQIDDGVHLPRHSLYDRICDPIVWAFSSLYAWVTFCIGISVWLGFGHEQQWGNNWQLYINSATAVEITFVSVFLQNTRQRHMRYLKECFALIMHEDMCLENRLREITGDSEPNPTAEFKYDYKTETTRGQRLIDYYGAIIGTGIGLVLSTIVFAVWIGIGSTMQWSSNWWLIIGTYTGLVGFVDGFVLRNAYFGGSRVVDGQFDVLANADAQLGDLLGISELSPDTVELDSLQTRIANIIGEWCSCSGAVIGSFVTVLAVLSIATAMHWSETGQLICNTPTMIIEGFLLLVLMQAHNMTNTHRRLQLRSALRRRLAINSQIYRFISNGVEKIGCEKDSQGRSLGS